LTIKLTELGKKVLELLQKGDSNEWRNI
jgi:hypothetical protein